MYAITTYRGKPATDEEINVQLMKLRNAYPAQTPAFFAVLAERIIDKQWTAEHIRDAVSHIIDTCEYPTFTPAKVMQFDKKKHLYNYNGYCNLITKGEAVDSDFGKIRIDGRCYWYLLHEN